MSEIGGVVHSIINYVELPRHLKEGMIKGLCKAAVDGGYDEDKLNKELDAVIKENLETRRSESLVKECEVSMLMDLKDLL